MDRSSKFSCKERSHQDFDKPAYCKKYQTLSQQTLPIYLDQSVCDYCINSNAVPDLSVEPFKSLYQKHLNDGTIQVNDSDTTILKNIDCVLLGNPINSVQNQATLLDLARSPLKCGYYHKCSVIPSFGQRHYCSSCHLKLNINYIYDHNPDFSIFKKMPKHGEIKKWAVGIITAPRVEHTLYRTVQSLKAAGWDKGHVFSEPNNYLTTIPEYHIVQRVSKLGIFGNWMLGLYELFIRNIDADAYLMIQDDIIVSPGTKKYLEESLWFNEDPHITCLFCPNAIDNDENFGWRTSNSFSGGPTAIVMSHETVQTIITDILPLRFYAIQKSKKSSFDDLGIFHLMSRKGYKVYYPKPSLCDHIGHISTHCQQTTQWAYAQDVLCDHQYIDIEHWFMITKTDTPLFKNTIESLTQFKDVNWHCGDLSSLKSKIAKEWTIITVIESGTTLVHDPRKVLIRNFTHTNKKIILSLGYKNDTIMYDTTGPCISYIIKTKDLEQQSFEDIVNTSIILDKPYWSLHNAP